MKIAFVNQPGSSVTPPVQDGSLEIWIYQIAKRLAQSCEVISFSKRGRLQKKTEHIEEVNYRHVSVVSDHRLHRILKIFSKFRNLNRPIFASILYYPLYALQISKELRARKCNFVHILNYSQFVPIIRALNPNIKIILHMQCEWLTQLDRVMIERRLGQTDLIVGCSEYITEKIRLRFPKLADLCHTIYNGVDINYFVINNSSLTEKSREDRRLLFVGRVSPEKGIHVLLEAFLKVAEHYPHIWLDIVGPKRQLPLEYLVGLSDDDKVAELERFYRGRNRQFYFSYLEKQIPARLANNVIFTGHVPHSDVINYYRNANLLINPSLSEAFGMSLVEAMAFEVPVICTRVGGMVEIVEEGKTGFLIDRDDASALAEKVLLLLTDNDLRTKMGKAARQRAMETFSWKRIAERLLFLYQNIGCR